MEKSVEILKAIGAFSVVFGPFIVALVCLLYLGHNWRKNNSTEH